MKICFRYRPFGSSGSFCPFRIFLILISLLSAGQAQSLPDWPESWFTVGRAQTQPTPASIIITGGYAVNTTDWDDAQISFRARAPKSATEVQIWAGFRY